MSIVKIILSLIFLLLALLLAPTSFAQDPGDAARIVITDRVVATDVQPIGVNLSQIAGGTNFTTNNLIRGSGMEPGVSRYLVRVERSGPGWIEWDQSLGGVHMYDQNTTGFGDGASVRLYRLVDEAGNPLDYGGGQELQMADEAVRVVYLGETIVPEGGWLAEGSTGSANRVTLADETLTLAYGDYAIFTVTTLGLTPEDVHPRLLEWFEEDVNYLYPWEGGSARLVPHTGPLPATFTEPGRSALLLTAPEGGAWFGQYLFHRYDDGEGQFYGQLTPGAAYRAEVWLKQEGLANGQVWFEVGGSYGDAVSVPPWTVTGDWAHYTVDFTGPPIMAANWHGSLALRVESAGQVWVDNFLVYRTDLPYGDGPFTPHPVAFDTLMAAMPQTGPKPAVRFYSLTYPAHGPMSDLLSNYPSGTIDFIYNVQPGISATLPHLLAWAAATGDGPADRVVPIITLAEEYNEEEWVQLVEYLGVPYDPAADTPESKPWAYLRSQQRGHGAPWTDDFREIVLEFGNETWHNGAFGGWDGFGRPYWVWQGGREYGLFAHHYLVETVMAQPWWDSYNLGDTITFSLNAGYDAEIDSYGELAVQQVPDVFIHLGHANYVGPKWETEDEHYDIFDDFGMQQTLVGAYRTMLPLIAEVDATRQTLMDAGLANYRPYAYEGGPSGYFVPGFGTEDQVAAAELYGKSVGMAVSALDAWLYSSLHGYGHQAMNAMAAGTGWTSHTMPGMGGYRPHTGWLALTLRNRYASGDEMLETTVTEAPLLALEGEQIPLVAAYTLQDDASLSVFLLSRSLDQTIPVEITLPIESCSSVTRYALTAPDGSPVDPRANNIEAINVVIDAVSVDAAACAGGKLTVDPTTGGTSGGLPPGAIYLYVLAR